MRISLLKHFREGINCLLRFFKKLGKLAPNAIHNRPQQPEVKTNSSWLQPLRLQQFEYSREWTNDNQNDIVKI